VLEAALAPTLYEMRVAWALLRVCANDSRFARYSEAGQAEVIRFFEYVDPEPTGSDVLRARRLLEGEAA
jgi:hypothetical protein